MESFRDTKIQRKQLTAQVKMTIWGRSAARCVLCAEWLIGANYFWHGIPVGELAHIVGASSGDEAPRGASDLDADERALEENILLLCHSCHRVIDSKAHQDKYTVEFLTTRKQEHEQRVKEVTNFPTLRPATVLRVHGDVRGTPNRASSEQISTSLLSTGLTGLDADTRNGMFDIMLDHSIQDAWAWDAARSKITDVVNRINEAIAGEDTSVIAVFAIAPIPILIFLGTRLDDKYETVLFPRRRIDSASSWLWESSNLPQKRFKITSTSDASEVEDVIVILNVSGTIDTRQLPQGLEQLPIVKIDPRDETPNPDFIDSLGSLNEFGTTWRILLSKIEEKWSRVQRLHIFAAVPITAAITIGRYRMRDVHPAFLLYQRTDQNSYEKVMEISE
ncbi:SAVED domain-containing protein [Corynebacterium glutamicum]|uniref:SMODS-associated and fused to various effectors domain-containing protein n=1 Tax=Corynebacterium glutamicum (strain R) TaxID=340322 RepID=A0AB72VF60_CORGB|nr:SAVED domain-containing protein [Corynebacterium glutamicum]BAQ21165.1 hypothetical protein cgR_6103 [Corynebacterium glutamicum R]